MDPFMGVHEEAPLHKERVQATFKELRPTCLNAMESPSVESFNALSAALKGVPSDILSSLVDFALFPVSTWLQYKAAFATEAQISSALACMKTVLSICGPPSLGWFEEHLRLLVGLLAPMHISQSNPRQPLHKREKLLSEDVHVLAMQTLLLLLVAVVRPDLKPNFDSNGEGAEDKAGGYYVPRMRPCTTDVQQAVSKHLCSPSSRPSVVLFVAVVVEHCRHTVGSRELKWAAIMTLQMMVLAMLGHNPTDAADTIATFLPGTLTALAHTATADYKQGYRVISAAVDTWGLLLVTCMADKMNPTHKADLWKDFTATTTAKQDTQPPENRNKGPLTMEVDRHDGWVVETADKAHKLLVRVCAAAMHPAWQVRVSLSHLAQCLLTQCTTTLRTSAGTLIDVLVRYLADEYVQVRESSCGALRAYAELLAQIGSPTASVLVESSLYDLVTSLPRLMRASDDTNKLAAVQLACGYVWLLGPRMRILLSVPTHLSRMVDVLLQILEFSSRGLKMIEDRAQSLLGPIERLDLVTVKDRTNEMASFFARENTTADGRDNDLPGDFSIPKEQPTIPDALDVPPPFRKSFRLFDSQPMMTMLRRFIRLLGYHTDIFQMVFELSGALNSTRRRRQAVFIMSELLLGAAGLGVDLVPGVDPIFTTNTGGNQTPKIGKTTKEDLQSVVATMVGLFLEQERWELPTTNTASPLVESLQATMPTYPVQETQEWTADQLIEHTGLQCLMLEGFAACARVIGIDFDDHIMSVLYPTLEKLASDNMVVHLSALYALKAMCQHCGYTGQPLQSSAAKPAWLQQNAPTYTSVGDLIRHNIDYLTDAVSHNLRHLDLHPTTPQVLTVMVQHSDLSLLDVFHDLLRDIFTLLEYQAPAYVTAFLPVFLELMRALRRWFPDGVDPPPKSESDPPIEEIEVPEDETEMGQKGKEPTSENGSSKPKFGSGIPDTPPPLAMAQSVMERCLHLASDDDVSKRVMALEVIREGCYVLCRATSILLPLINTLWPVLVLRLKDTKPVVRIPALMVLEAMTAVSKDFVVTRVISDAWPAIHSLLSIPPPQTPKGGSRYPKQVTYFKAPEAPSSNTPSIGPVPVPHRPVVDAWYTIGYKSRVAALHVLASLCRLLPLRLPSVDAIITTCMPYLHADQPPELKIAAKKVFLALAAANPDAVWLTVTSADISMSSYKAQIRKLKNQSATGTNESAKCVKGGGVEGGKIGFCSDVSSVPAWESPCANLNPGPGLFVCVEGGGDGVKSEGGKTEKPSFDTTMGVWPGTVESEGRGYEKHEYTAVFHEILESIDSV